MVEGLQRYVSVQCFDLSKLKLPYDPDERRAVDLLAFKATDDHSAENCVENRMHFSLIGPPEINEDEKALFITCSDLLCIGNFGLRGHLVQLVVAKENSMAAYMSSQKNSHNPTLAQPRLDQIFTDLHKWREVVEPTRALLESFVVAEPN